MYQRILVPVDGSGTSTRGLQEALRLAQLTGARVRILHVMDRLTFANAFDAYVTHNSDLMPLMKEAAQKILDDGSRRAETAGVPFDTLLVENLTVPIGERVEECIKDWNADLVVIGTHGRRGFKRALMGSDAEQILRHCPVPVLLVKAAEGIELKDVHARSERPEAAAPGDAPRGHPRHGG